MKKALKKEAKDRHHFFLASSQKKFGAHSRVMKIDFDSEKTRNLAIMCPTVSFRCFAIGLSFSKAAQGPRSLGLPTRKYSPCRES